jgi:hypothetical protein
MTEEELEVVSARRAELDRMSDEIIASKRPMRVKQIRLNYILAETAKLKKLLGEHIKQADQEAEVAIKRICQQSST